MNEFWKTNDNQDDVDHDNGGGGDDGYIDDYDDDGDDDDRSRISEDWFMHFVVGVVENRGPSHLEKVVYCWRYDYDDHESALKFDYSPPLDWLHHVALLMPRVIIVYVERGSSLHVPDSVFSCASLQKLMVSLYSDGGTFLTQKSINLPCLKTIELCCVEFGNNFVHKLFLGCPALESMILENCGLHVSAISSNELKMLTLHECSQSQPLRIFCPALVSLSIDNLYQGDSISLQNMTSLVKADISLFLRDDYSPLPTLNLLGGLSNATYLKLDFSSPELKEQLDKDIPNCTTFNNLKSLEIGAWDMINNFDLVACFIQNSTNLQKLTLELQKLMNELRLGGEKAGYRLSYHLGQMGSRADTREEAMQKEVGDPFFHLEYLETLKIVCAKKEFASSLVKLLGRYIKTIGNIIVDTQIY